MLLPGSHLKSLFLRLTLVSYQARAYPDFCSMKRLGVFLPPPPPPPPGWVARPSQGYPQQYIRRYPFIHLGGERHYEIKVSYPRPQRSAPVRNRTRIGHLVNVLQGYGTICHLPCASQTLPSASKGALKHTSLHVLWTTSHFFVTIIIIIISP